MSDKKALDQTIQNLTLVAEELASPLGLIVVDIRFGQQGRRRTLDVTIFKKESWVSLADCEQLSRLLEAELDRRATSDDGPLVEGAFDLQVQSPGIDRQIKTEREFAVFAGQSVQVKTKEKVGDLGVHFKGILVGNVGGKVQFAKAQAITQGKAKKAPIMETEEVTFDTKNLIDVRLYAEDLQKRGESAHVKN